MTTTLVCFGLIFAGLVLGAGIGWAARGVAKEYVKADRAALNDYPHEYLGDKEGK